MATLREYFDTDPKALTYHKDWILRAEGADELRVVAKIHYEFLAGAKHWSFYFPSEARPSAIEAILAADETSRCELSSDDGLETRLGHASQPDEMLSSNDLVFTGLVTVYFDGPIDTHYRKHLQSVAAAHGLKLRLLDTAYADARARNETPLAFVSHDSRDKEFVRKLAQTLVSMGCPIWYDEYSLQVGDRLRASIEHGLKTTKKCILVLSPNFFSNTGWGRAEFDAIFTREILQKQNVILPVWHGVTATDVYDYSPGLADRVGLPSTLELKELAGKLFNAIKT